MQILNKSQNISKFKQINKIILLNNITQSSSWTACPKTLPPITISSFSCSMTNAIINLVHNIRVSRYPVDLILQIRS